MVNAIMMKNDLSIDRSLIYNVMADDLLFSFLGYDETSTIATTTSTHSPNGYPHEILTGIILYCSPSSLLSLKEAWSEVDMLLRKKQVREMYMEVNLVSREEVAGGRQKVISCYIGENRWGKCVTINPIFGDNQVKVYGWYMNDVKVGDWDTIDHNGILREKVTYSNHGLKIRTIREDDSIRSIETYNGNETRCTMYSLRAEDPNVPICDTINRNTETGQIFVFKRLFYPNGSVMEESSILSGQLHGKCVKYACTFPSSRYGPILNETMWENGRQVSAQDDFFD